MFLFSPALHESMEAEVVQQNLEKSREMLNEAEFARKLKEIDDEIGKDVIFW